MPDKNKENKIQEMQIIEQSLQNLLMQKQAFQIELSETKSALKEIEKASDEVFRIIGQLMIKADRGKILDELSNKEKLFNLRLESIEKQEGSLAEKLEKLQSEVLK